ncbi:MAG: hypothetical protein P8100_11195, partial [bacterium]
IILQNHLTAKRERRLHRSLQGVQESPPKYDKDDKAGKKKTSPGRMVLSGFVYMILGYFIFMWIGTISQEGLLVYLILFFSGVFFIVGLYRFFKGIFGFF